jgi:hypothetical protein
MAHKPNGTKIQLDRNIKKYFGQAIFVAFGFLAFVSLAGAAVTIGSLGSPIQGPDAARALRQAFVATGMSLVFFTAGYFARRMLTHRPPPQPRTPE